MQLLRVKKFDPCGWVDEIENYRRPTCIYIMQVPLREVMFMVPMLQSSRFQHFSTLRTDDDLDHLDLDPSLPL